MFTENLVPKSLAVFTTRNVEVRCLCRRSTPGYILDTGIHSGRLRNVNVAGYEVLYYVIQNKNDVACYLFTIITISRTNKRDKSEHLSGSKKNNNNKNVSLLYIMNGINMFFSKIFNGPKHVPVQVILLENLHVILEKTPRNDIRKEVLPLLYTAFDFSDIEVQVSFHLNYSIHK